MEYGEINNHIPKQNKKINCFQCVHFRITWEPSKPRACALFGFKGTELPSVTIKEVSGKPCPAFKAKK